MIEVTLASRSLANLSIVLRTIIIYSLVSNSRGVELQLELILQCRIEGLDSSNVLRTIIIYSSVLNRRGGQ